MVYADVFSSAFLLFCNDERPLVRQLYPTLSVTDTAKELGRRWMICADKHKYDAMAARDQLRYRQVRYY